MNYKIPLNACTYGDEEIAAAIEVLKSTHVTMGENCRAFEKEFAEKMGVKEAVFVNSGSSANLLAWFSLMNPQFGLRRRRGWQVIVPAVSWATTYWPIVQAGGVPVLVDCDPQTFQMDVDQMRSAISSKTVAICPVHVLGNAVNMDDVMSFAESRGLYVIEDTCEALGTKFRDKLVGTFGHFGTYSFFFSHHITSIEGGMVVTNNSDFADVARMMRAHGWSRDSVRREEFEALAPSIDPSFFFVTTGFNLRPTEINAVIGRIQLRKLEMFNKRRNDIAAYWDSRFYSSKFFRPMRATPGTEMARFGYPVMCYTTEKKQILKKILKEAGIETRPIVSGNIARHPAMSNVPSLTSSALTVANEITDRGLMWGLHPKLSDSDVEYVAETIMEADLDA